MGRFFFTAFFILLLYSSFAQKAEDVKFEEYFRYSTLRFDFNLGGNHVSETVYPVQMKQEPFWGGPVKHLTDPFGYGNYRVVVIDSASGKTIYTRGFANLFQEWQGTPEAKTISRTYYQVVTFPFPKNTIRLNIEKRSYETGSFTVLYSSWVNPEKDYFISKESPDFIPSVKFRNSGTPVNKIDIAFLAEGYTKGEMDKFRADAQRMGDELLNMEPFSLFRDRFNFYAVESVSEEKGVDIPGEDLYMNTVFNSTFYTFDSDRYLTSSDLKSIFDAAANVPWDAIIILVNHNRYGGGGFFNQYAMSTVDNVYSVPVMIHEFGHSFAGLADEYVGSVNYSDYYNLAVEPWEPNITTNVNFSSKWKDEVKKGTPVPTPRSSEFAGVVGMFEGGGYMAKGIYSPQTDCRMKTNEAPGFCKACNNAIIRMIRFYSE